MGMAQGRMLLLTHCATAGCCGSFPAAAVLAAGRVLLPLPLPLLVRPLLGVPGSCTVPLLLLVLRQPVPVTAALAFDARLRLGGAMEPNSRKQCSSALTFFTAARFSALAAFLAALVPDPGGKGASPATVADSNRP
jgi:hypothetical protein